MTYWYIDLENVPLSLDDIIQKVRRYDRVVLAWSTAAPSIPIHTLSELAKKRVKVEYFHCLTGGDSSMDFQILMLVAENCALRIGDRHVVYSGDLDYAQPCIAWFNRGYSVTFLQHNQAQLPVNKLTTKLLALGVPQCNINECIAYAKEAKTAGDLNAYVGRFVSGQQQSEAYHLLKPFLTIGGISQC